MSDSARELFAREPRYEGRAWLWRALGLGLLLAVGWSRWPTSGLDHRLLKDAVLFLAIPAAFVLFNGRSLGWRVDRLALRNTVLLAAFVVPFYVVGSSLPTVRAYYPMWGGSEPVVGRQVQQLLVVVAAETYYRGLLCVSLSELGRKAALLSPVLYAFHHLGKPPIELVLSGPTDLLFGLVDYESNSILPSVVAHGGGLAVLDWLVVREPLLASATLERWLGWLPIPL